MALKFRRGTTAQKSGSLSFGEPYVNTTLGTLQIGGDNGDITLLVNSSSTGISGSSLDITGNAKIDGNLTLGGNITIGDQTTDTVTVTANLSSSLIPSATNTFDLGSSTRIWRDLYISTGSIKFVGGTSVVKELTLATITNLESATGSNDTKFNTLATYTGSVETRLTQIGVVSGSLITSASADKVSINNINTFSGSQLTQNTALATITGSLITTASNNVVSITNLNTQTASLETRATSLATITGSLITTASNLTQRVAANEAVSGTFARTNSANTFVGNQTITGSLVTSGSKVEFNVLWPGTGSEQHIIKTDGFTLDNRTYEYAGFALEHYEDSPGVLHNAIALYMFDPTNTYGSEIIIGPYRTHMQVYPSGSGGNMANVSVQDLNDGRTQALVYGDFVQIGNIHAESIIMGNSGSVIEISGSIKNAQLNAIGIITGSLITSASTAKTTNDSQDISITNLNTFSGSQLSKDSTLATYTASVDTRLTEIGLVSGSLIASASAAKTTNDSQGISITNLNTTTASLLIETSNLETFSASVLTRLTEIGVVSGSLITSASNAKTTNDAQDVSITNLNTFSGSQLTQNSSLATITGSLITTASNLTQRVAANEAVSGTFARTNSSNVFNGTQTITGSLYISQDLVVAGSSSIQNISSSNLVIGTSYVTLNTNSPSSRFAGLQIIDSGSAGSSGSFLYDAVQDEFIFVHKGNGTNVTSSHFILGPETYDNLGSESYLTNNRLPKGSGNEHLNDSQISDDGTTVSIPGALTVTGNITGPIRATNGIFSGSSQIPNSSITNAQLVNNYVGIVGTAVTLGTTISAATIGNAIGAFSGSSQVDLTATTNYASGILTRLNAVGVVSGSSQVIGILSSLNSYTASNDTTNTTQNSRLDQLSTASGSAITRLNALEVETANLEAFSSSALTRLGALEVETANLEAFTSSINTTIKTRLNAETVISGSSQVAHDSTTGYSANRHVDHTAVSITAGSGLTGGGDISATRTLSIATGGVTNGMLANSTISGISLGSNLATLTIGSGLSGTSYNGSSAVTIANTGVLSNVAGTGVSVSSATGNVTISIGQAVGTSDNVRFGSIGVGMAASGTSGRIDAANDIVAYSSSDIRFKENIKPIENAIDKIRKISGNTYDWKAENKEFHGYEGNDVGVIAQEIEAVLPQLVQTRESGYKAVKYDKLVALLIEGIKEQQLQIEQLRIDLDNCRNNKGL